MYQGQKSMLVDEMKGNKMSPTEFNEVCDKYPLHVNIKGGVAICKVEKIFITSNYMPQEWWKEGVVPLARDRRIDEVHYHHAYREKKVYLSDKWEENPTHEGTAWQKCLADNPTLRFVPLNNNPVP